MARAGYIVNSLDVGKTYVAIAMLWRDSSAPVVTLTADGATFGPPVSAINKWTETKVTFVAQATTQTVGIQRLDQNTGTTYIGGMAVVEAPYAGQYFDGQSGPDYVWHGAINDSLSLHYSDRTNRSYLITQLLLENCPLGVTPGVHRWAAPEDDLVVVEPPPPPVVTKWVLGDPLLSILGSTTNI